MTASGSRLKWGSILLTGFTVLFLITLYLPFLMMLLLSFSGPTGGPTLPMRGVSLYWYQQLFGLISSAGITATSDFSADVGAQMAPIGTPLVRSLVQSTVAMIISALLGLVTAMAFRRPFRGSSLVFYLILLGAITPGLTLGLGVLLLAKNLGLGLHWYTTGLLTQIIWTYPFSFVIMLIYFNRFDRRLEEAAASLGASPWVTFKTVTLPLIAPGLLTAALFSFTLSFDEYIRSFFSVGPEQTLPVLVLASTTQRITPKLYALGSVTTVVSFLMIAVYLLLSRQSHARVRAK